MTKFIFVRHGEPDYTRVSELKFKGHGRDLAQLTDAGKAQAMKASKEELLKGAQIIVSSPYTRTLQTSAILSKELDLEIDVVTDLHEWLPDLTFNYDQAELVGRAAMALSQNKGDCPSEYLPPYETLESVFNRVKAALKPYHKYDKVIVVCHGVVMRQFQYHENLEYCGMFEVDMDDHFEWCGFVVH